MSRKLYLYHKRLSFLRQISPSTDFFFFLLSVKSDAFPFSQNGILTQPLRYLLCDLIANGTIERAHEHLPPRRMNPDNGTNMDLNPGDSRCSALRRNLWVLLYSPCRGQPDTHHIPPLVFLPCGGGSWTFRDLHKTTHTDSGDFSSSSPNSFP